MGTTKILVIAEAGVNHNGSLDTAFKLIDAAKEAGADVVKFQTFRAETLASRQAPKATYQLATTDAKQTQFEMLKELELSEKMHVELIRHCRKTGIEFLSTAFDEESLGLLIDKFDVGYVKIPSGEITNGLLLLKAAASSKPVIISTGMCALADIESALGVLAFGLLTPAAMPSLAAFETAYFSNEGRALLSQRITLLHCTTAYPTPFEHVNLKVMDTLRQCFNVKVGLSDHTPGIAVAIAAAARGASVIEKHFTLDKNLPGPDHKASLEPAELTAMVTSIRQVELSLGEPHKVPTAADLKNRPIARKSLVAREAIKKGETFTVKNLGSKRPGTGLSPLYYWEWLGKVARCDFAKDEVIS